MKQGRKLTRSEKEILKRNMLNWSEWEFLADCIDENGRPTSYFKITNKLTGKINIISRFGRKG